MASWQDAETIRYSRSRARGLQTRHTNKFGGEKEGGATEVAVSGPGHQHLSCHGNQQLAYGRNAILVCLSPRVMPPAHMNAISACFVFRFFSCLLVREFLSSTFVVQYCTTSIGVRVLYVRMILL